MIGVDREPRMWTRLRIDGRYLVESSQAQAAFLSLQRTETLDLLQEEEAGPISYIIEGVGYLLVPVGCDIMPYRMDDYRRFDFSVVSQVRPRASVSLVLEAFTVPAFAWRYGAWVELARYASVALVGKGDSAHSWRLALQLAEDQVDPFGPFPVVDDASQVKYVTGVCAARWGRVEVYNNTSSEHVYSVSARFNPFGGAT